jgi:CRISPR-associated protein Csm1
MTQEEKIIILAGLFHDIGKFRQRCVDKFETHQIESSNFIKDHQDLFKFVLDKNPESLNKLIFLVENHHNYSSHDELLEILKDADHLSASERVEAELNNDKKVNWGYNYLCSLNSKINLNSKTSTPLRFYKHVTLTKKNYNALIPTEETNKGEYKYKESDWQSFVNDFKTIMYFYEKDEDFMTLINLLLVLFEKYMWCIPDFTGNEETDISLFNHLRDVCGLSHAIYKNKMNDKANNRLKLLVGDIPGIQDYIFDVNSTRAAKMLRGRSTFVQVLSRMFASVYLDAFNVTECSLIMLAGGKFYLILPVTGDYNELLIRAKEKIEKYLIDTFNYDLKFVTGDNEFSYTDLMNKNISFGNIIEQAEKNLVREKNNIFKNNLFNSESFSENKFIISKNFIDDSESDNVKCAVTEKPIFENDSKKIKAFDVDENDIVVNSQAYKEYQVGSKILRNNVVIEFEEDNLNLKEDSIYHVSDFEKTEINYSRKILLNPDIDGILDIIKGKRDIIKKLKNCSFVDVANYCSLTESGGIMSFDKMSEKSIGAEYLTLIKGDVDNLGLIMAYGLHSGNNDLTGISRTTTFSNHYKYFFSFFLNGFLKENDKKEEDNFIYTIFAGGDDLMLVCPQSRAVKFISEFNNVFKDFVCNNNEIHVSYSITHFKHSTPIRIVAEFSENNQELAKENDVKYSKIEKIIEKEKDCFCDNKNKSSMFVFNSVIKNSEISLLIETTNNLVKWGTKPDNGKEEISSGLIRNLLIMSELLKDFREKGDTAKLMWHPMLTYSINRNLKKDGKYKSVNPGIEKFFESILSISKDEHEKQLERVLYPALCEAIYELRK